ncbi:MAG: diacylglycerol/lipid kinase family protein [Candidatus Brocadia sp.]
MKSTKTVQIVVNPCSGKRNGSRLLKLLNSGLKAMGYQTTILVTEKQGDTLQWARNCKVPPDYLICVSGDDTLDELAYAAMLHHTPLIHFPTGFGNIIAREFGHQAAISSVLRLLEDGEKLDVDMAVRKNLDSNTEKYFLSVASYGLLDTVKHQVEHNMCSRPQSPRSLRYVLTAVKYFFSVYPLPSMTIEVDGKVIAEESAIALISNIPAYAGFLEVIPNASPFDGLLDVCVIPNRSKWKVISCLFEILLHRPSVERRIIRRRGKFVRVTFQPNTPFFSSDTLVTAQNSQETTETITIIPNAVPILSHKGRNFKEKYLS